MKLRNNSFIFKKKGRQHRLFLIKQKSLYCMVIVKNRGKQLRIINLLYNIVVCLLAETCSLDILKIFMLRFGQIGEIYCKSF